MQTKYNGLHVNILILFIFNTYSTFSSF